MGRIKGRKPEDTREAVLAAATVTFAERGFANATLGMIAARAGVTAATLPYHFGDKQGLYDAVVDAIYKDLVAFGPTLEGTRGFYDVVDAIYGWAEERRDGIRVMLRSIIEAGGLDTKVRELRMGPVLTGMSQLVAGHYGVPVANAREMIVTMTHLVMRFVTNRPEDNCVAFGVQTSEEARVRIVDVMARVGANLMGISTDARGVNAR
ncbi:MAG: TetR/AcrR family transcriptional regulator [Deltaproteobacteria bacterium]|nr:MAG: TetR/AcrR family transcriptional regulator [Deltaproteobacteria bacterium]